MSNNVTSQKTNLMQMIERTSPAQLPAVPQIALRFKKLFAIIHPGAKAEIFYEAEKFHFTKLVQENKVLQECTKLSLYGCFMDVAVNGLSFDPSFKHLYIVPYNINVGTRDAPKWEKRASLQISGFGELLLRQKQGQIKYADNPVLVYEGDKFSYGVEHDKFFVEHRVNLSERSDRIMACYIKIIRHDDSIDYKVLTAEDMDRFRKFSKDPKSKAWTDGLAGMWIAKCIKHAFKNYPKVRTGEFSALASNQVDEEAEVVSSTVKEPAESMKIPDNIDYGMNGNGEHSDDTDDESFAQPAQRNGAPPVMVDDDDF